MRKDHKRSEVMERKLRLASSVKKKNLRFACFQDLRETPESGDKMSLKVSPFTYN